MKKSTKKIEQSEIELLRSGINDEANLLADDELSDLFGGYQCGKGFCMPKYGDSCLKIYCESKFYFD